MQDSIRLRQCLCILFILAVTGSARAQLLRPDIGKLLATGGVSQIEGAGGGGLVPWALVTGYGSRDSWGGNAHRTHVRTQDYALDTHGVALGIADRLEFSYARQQLRGSLAPLDRLRIRQDIFGVKLKLAGDAVYDQDRAMPQLALGMMVKRNKALDGIDAAGVRDLGAKHANGVDLYVAATKILLEHSLLLNGTVRASKANQMGLLGFGGAQGDRHQALLEVSAAYLVSRKLVAGVEYRMKPRNLAIDAEKDAFDAFLAWFPSKHVSVTAAYAALGDITVFNPRRQHGLYLSVQTGF